MSNVHTSYVNDGSTGIKKFLKNARSVLTNRHLALTNDLVQLFKYNGCTKFVNDLILVSDIIEFLGEIAKNRTRLFPIYYLLKWSHSMGFDLDDFQYIEIFKMLMYDRDGYIYAHYGFEFSYVKTDSVTNLLTCISKNDRKLAKEYLFRIASGRINFHELFHLYYTTLINYSKSCENEELYRTIMALGRVHTNGNSSCALENIQKLTFLLFTVGIDFAKSSSLAFFDIFSNQVKLNDKNRADTIVLHELGHCLDYNFSAKPQNFEEVLNRARGIAFSQLFKLKKFLNDLEAENFYNSNGSFKQAEQYIISTHGSILNLKNLIFQSLRESFDNNSLNVAFDNIFQSYKLDEDTKKSIFDLFNDGAFNLNALTDIIYNSILNGYADFYLHTNLRTYFSDIVSNIFEGDAFTIGYELFHIDGHTNKYYRDRPNADGAYSELMANYNVLKLYNCTSMINELRMIFGNELFDLIEGHYRNQNEYYNVPGVGSGFGYRI